MLFAGVYPTDADQYEELRASLEKLQLNDASLTFVPESSAALGFGFRCGFLGLLHMEIVQERLDREFNMDVIATVPNVSYNLYTTKGELIEVHNPSGMPAPTMIDHVEEPYIRAQIISKDDFIGPIIKPRCALPTVRTAPRRCASPWRFPAPRLKSPSRRLSIAAAPTPSPSTPC